MKATRVGILYLLLLQWGTLEVMAYLSGSPLCDFGPSSLAIIQSVMKGPDTGTGLASQSQITWTMSATKATAGHSVSLNFTFNQPNNPLLLGFLVYAQHADGNRYGFFDLNQCQPAGYAKYVNATMVPGGVCPGGNGPTITQSNNNCDYQSYLFVYVSDVNHPGVITFNAFMMIDGTFTPDARGNWFLMNPQNVTFLAPAGTTGSVTTGLPTSAAVPTTAAQINNGGGAQASNTGLPARTIAGIVVGVVLGVIFVGVFCFPIVWAATHKDDPRVKRITGRMSSAFKK
jgi:hypothetical protein